MMLERSGIKTGWRHRVYVIIFEADTPLGKLFDLSLIASIVLSVIAVSLESVASIRAQWGPQLRVAEWFFTIAFSLEYLMRIISVRHPLKYMLSFYGIVDVLAIIPTYLAVFLPGTQYFIVIRALRILRVFRVMKLVLYMQAGNIIMRAMIASQRKITVFLFAILTLVLIIGSLMYLIEGAENGFTNIPVSIYWTIVTLTTVGYGDIAPQTVLGKFFASIVMIMGYSIIAVPTGIVSAEMAIANRRNSPVRELRTCNVCNQRDHDAEARYCSACGTELSSPQPDQGTTSPSA